MNDIISTLKKFQPRGSFCTKIPLPLTHLSLKIKTLGELSFPLKPKAVQTLIKLAKPARYGLKDKTLLDKNVRNSWEISKAHIQFINKDWEKDFKALLEKIKNELGLPVNSTLKASLHNMLIYEQGQFFQPHQDSEKEDNMIASLVLLLPSEHEGGALLIDHQGEKKQFQTSRLSLNECHTIAFYADCYHEVKPIKKGYRVALTYNLTLHESKDKNSKEISQDLVNELVHGLESYFTNRPLAEKSHYTDKLAKWVYLLDHQYTEKGLSWHRLKNIDQERAFALKKAAEILDLEIFLCLADIQETWGCEEDYDDYYHDYEFTADDTIIETQERGISLTDIINDETTLNHFINSDNKIEDIKAFWIPNENIFWTTATNQFKPFESQYEGYMGNYGNTVDRWYHRAAIVLWKKQDHYAVLFDIDPEKIIEEILSLSKKKNSKNNIRNIIDSLSPYWSNEMRNFRSADLMKKVLQLVALFDDAQYIVVLLKDFTLEQLTPENIKDFAKLSEKYGDTFALEQLEIWTKSDRYHQSQCQKLFQLVSALSPEIHGKLIAWLMHYQLEQLIKEDNEAEKNKSRVQKRKESKTYLKKAIEFLETCLLAKNEKMHLDYLEHLMKMKSIYPTLLLLELYRHFDQKLAEKVKAQFGYIKLKQHILTDLKKEASLGLRLHDDWSIQEKSSCSCQDCLLLNSFLQSPTEIKRIWPLAKDRRMHIHQIIDGLDIPVTHETEHTGSPHKLILVKTEKLHQEAQKRFNLIEKTLKHFYE